MQKLVLALMLAACIAPALRAQQPTGVFFITVANTTDRHEEEKLVASLTKAGFHSLPEADDSGNGVIHVKVGPYTSKLQVANARKRLAAAGFKLPEPTFHAAGLATAGQHTLAVIASPPPPQSPPPPPPAPAMSDLEAQALAHLGGGNAPASSATGNDLEAQALANLGGGAPSGPPATGADLEAQALQAMQANSAGADRQHQQTAQAQIQGSSSTQEDYQQQLRDHAEKVADLRQRVEEADSEAEQAENQAQQAKASAEQAANGGGGVFGTLAIALSGGVQFKAEQDAQKKRAEADQLRAQLTELGEEVIQPPPLRNSIEEDAGRDRISEARDQGLANINAVAAQNAAIKAQQAAQPQTYTKTYTTTQNNGDRVKQTIVAGAPGAQITIQCFAPGQTQPYKTQTFTHSSSSEFFMNLPPVCTRTASAAAPPSSGTGTGTAKPPVPYTPAPSSGGTVVATNGTICPPSGWIMHQTGDVSVGQQCTPGQPIDPSLSASSGTSGSGSASGSSNPGSSGAGSGTSSGGDQVIGKSSCITSQFGDNPQFPGYHSGDFLILSNLCAEGLRATWYMGTQVGAAHAIASYATFVTDTTRQPGADNRVSTYVCPLDHPIATQASGVEVTGRDQPYHCEKRSF
jgi:hypothetical protein